MITDIFSDRYREQEWTTIGDNDTRAVHQMTTLFFDKASDVFRYPVDMANKISSMAHTLVCRELGVNDLFSRRPPGYFDDGETWASACRSFLTQQIADSFSGDAAMKHRLSLLELMFRGFEGVGRDEGRVSGVEPILEELNERLRRLSFPFRYHAGMFHRADDRLSETQTEEPFWEVLRGARWRNVDTDVKEAIELRDTGGRDPAFYAAKALESAIKVISDERGWSTGSERGAANFIDNLLSERADRFITVWEADLLKSFFRHVRNPFGHGAGSGDMPSLTAQQTDWAIEFCMSWIKSLIRRM